MYKDGFLDDEDDDDMVSFFMVPLLGELKVTERSMCLMRVGTVPE